MHTSGSLFQGTIKRSALKYVICNTKNTIPYCTYNPRWYMRSTYDVLLHCRCITYAKTTSSETLQKRRYGPKKCNHALSLIYIISALWVSKSELRRTITKHEEQNWPKIFIYHAILSNKFNLYSWSLNLLCSLLRSLIISFIYFNAFHSSQSKIVHNMCTS